MGFLKGTATFTRLAILNREKEPSADAFDRRLKARAFRDFFPEDAERNIGWTDIEDVLDTSFASGSYNCGPFRIFSLRTDRRGVPASLMKIRCLEEERKFLREREQKRLYREQRDAIRESVHRKLLEQAPPVPSFCDVAWSVGDGIVWFASHSPKTVQEFMDFFKETFELQLQPFVPWDPTALEAAGMSPALIGREFLTWLWFKSQERSGSVELPGVGDIALTFVRRLALESGEGEYTESIVCSGQHADLKEGKAAVRQGKRVKDGRMELGRDTVKWELTVKADGLQIQSLKLPVMLDGTEDEADAEGRNLERLYLIDTATKTLDNLFALFLKLRASDAWAAETAAMAKWAGSGI